MKNKFITQSLYNVPLAITTGKLAEIEAFATAHFEGKSFADLFADSAAQGYEIIDGVAIIPVYGVISQRMNMFSRISGGTSTEMLGAEVQRALADNSVNSILLDIDSPGGSVSGVQAVSDLIYNARAQKTITAYINPCAASGAYWIASASAEIVMAEGTSIAGSIGVVTLHKDISGAEKMMGVKSTEIYAGKYKRIASSFAPLGEEAQAHIQADVDYIYSLFVDAVARNRGTDAETVLANMADGRIFIGQQAVDAGLVDRIESFDAVLSRLSKPKSNREVRMSDEKTMTIEALRQDHPELVKAITAEAHKSGMEAGASAERARITSIMEMSVDGFDSVIKAGISDSNVTAGDIAMQIVKAQKDRGANVSDIRSESPKIPFAPAVDEDKVAQAETKQAISSMAAGGNRKRK